MLFERSFKLDRITCSPPANLRLLNDKFTHKVMGSMTTLILPLYFLKTLCDS